MLRKVSVVALVSTAASYHPRGDVGVAAQRPASVRRMMLTNSKASTKSLTLGKINCNFIENIFHPQFLLQLQELRQYLLQFWCFMQYLLVLCNIYQYQYIAIYCAIGVDFTVTQQY